MKTNKDIVKNFATRKFYGQGFNGSPITLIYGASLSAINVHEKLGMSYEGFLFEFKKDYGMMKYFEKDLVKIGNYMWEHMKKDPTYLGKFIQTYRKEQDISLKLYMKIDKTNLKTIPEKELLDLLQKSIKAMRDGVGTGHVIEGITFVGDLILKEKLDKFLADKKKSNEVFALLTTPEEKSFLSKAEDLLHKISKDPKNKKLINKFQKEFGWIRNSYDYRRPFADEEIVKEAKSKRHQKSKTLLEVKKEKKKLEKGLNLPAELIHGLDVLAKVGAWQDERKKFILLACEYIFRNLEEYAKRVKVDIKYLRYALPGELENAKKVEKDLKKRYEKSYYAVTTKRVSVVIGKDYDEVHSSLRREEEKGIRQINGMVASSGKVIGKARICSTIKSLEKVQYGDILVASMTRPEYMGAMQKAVGFVTDEGGITCHAAIISREMGKPCVIGTRNATKILKDGDLVQVDAIHGVVRILESNK